MMKIEKYSFGKITIKGETHTKDLIIFPDKIQSNWRRKKGHLLQLQDLNSVLNFKPTTIIIGTGAYGLMKIDKHVLKELKERKIDLIEEKTKKAIEIYNQINKTNKVIAGLHLTC